MKHKTYLKADPRTWELMRAAYLGGETAPSLAARFGVTVSAMRARMGREGWTKSAYGAAQADLNNLPPSPVSAAAPETALETAPDAFEPAETAAALGRDALAAARHALAKGRASDAKTFGVLAEYMRKLAGAERLAALDNAEREERIVKPFEQELQERFRNVAHVAYAMLHSPETAPAVFREMVEQWRAENLPPDLAVALDPNPEITELLRRSHEIVARVRAD